MVQRETFSVMKRAKRCTRAPAPQYRAFSTTTYCHHLADMKCQSNYEIDLLTKLAISRQPQYFVMTFGVTSCI
jgi:hypothetical protein